MSFSIRDVGDYLSTSGLTFNPKDVVCLFDDCVPGSLNPMDIIKVPILNDPIPVLIHKNDYVKLLFGMDTEIFKGLAEETKKVVERVYAKVSRLDGFKVTLIKDVSEAATAMVAERLARGDDGEGLVNHIYHGLAAYERKLVHPDYIANTLAKPGDKESCSIIVSAACIVVGYALLAEHPIAGAMLILGAEGYGSMGCGAVYDQ